MSGTLKGPAVAAFTALIVLTGANGTDDGAFKSVTKFP